MRRRTTLPLLAAAFILVFGTNLLRAQLVTYTWTGLGHDGWAGYSANWANAMPPAEDLTNTRIVFGSSASSLVRYYEFFANQVVVQGHSRPYDIQGGWDTLHLGSGGLTYDPAGAVRSVWDDRIQLEANQTWNIAGGTFVLEGEISDAVFDPELQTDVSQNYRINKTGSGTLILNDPDNDGWSGGLTLSAGRVVIPASDYYLDPIAHAAGNGTIIFNGGTLVAAQNYYGDDTSVVLANNVESNGLIATENHVPLRLATGTEGEGTVTLNTHTTITTSRERLYVVGAINEASPGTRLTVDANGAVVLFGSSGWTGGTEVTKGVLIFAGEDNTPGLSDAILVGPQGYVGISPDQNVGGFLDQIDAVNSTGTLGFDSDSDFSESETFFAPIDLTGFNASVRLGSATYAELSATAIITPQGTSYRFGGGGGHLDVESALTDLVNEVPPDTVRSVVLDSPAELPLSVLFLNPANSFTGGVSATHSGAIFAAGTLPGTGALSLGTGGYIGIEGVHLIEATNAPQDFINRFASSTDRGMIGFDEPGEHVTITQPLSLAGFADAAPGIYLGTASRAHLDGPITPQDSVYRFGAYKGGQLTVNSQLTNDTSDPENVLIRSVHVGDPTSLGTMGDIYDDDYSRVTLSGNNTYTGTTTLYTGELWVGQTNGAVGTDPTTALGTGALIVQPHSLSLPPGYDDFRPRLTGDSGIIIPNAVQLNADVTVNGYESSLSLTGSIEGSGEIYTDGALYLRLTGNNSAFTGGIYLSGYTTLALGSNNAAGTGPLSFGYTASAVVDFETAAPVIGGLFSNEDDDFATLRFLADNAVLTVNQAADGVFRGDILSASPSNAMRVVKSGSARLELSHGNLGYRYIGDAYAPSAGTPEPTLPGSPNVSLQVNQGILAIGDNFTLENEQNTVWVNGGTLELRDSYVGAPIAVSSGRLTGIGYIKSATIGANAVLSPGHADAIVGYLDFQDLTLAARGVLEWNIGAADPSAGGYDLVSISSLSTLHVTAGTTADDPLTTDINEDDRFTLRLISLGANGAPGALTDVSGDRSYTWTIFDATWSSIEGFDPDKFVIDASQFFTNLEPSTFELSVSPDGKLVQLTFQAVPEPSTYALFALGLGFIGLTIWRRRRA